jgi:hypothetical protein
MSKWMRWSFLLAILAATPATTAVADEAFRQSILQALRLPTVTRESRNLGVPASDLQSIFGTARRLNLPAGNLTDLFDEENKAIRENGRVDNFGAFVQTQLDAGLRGRDLAAAIHAEHAARGMGKGNAGNPGKPGNSQGQSGNAGGKTGNPGNSGQPGKSNPHGKPESPGKSDQNDKSGKKGGTQ